MGATEGSFRPTHSRPRMLSQVPHEFGFRSSGALDGLEVTGITVTSRDVRPGDIFAALPGVKVHGAVFADQAIIAGAVAIVTDPAGEKVIAKASETSVALAHIPVLVTDDVRASLGQLSRWVYHNDDEVVPVYGVTGTNGKTSVIYLLDAILTQLGVPTGLSTTAERRVGNERYVSGLTTPEAPEINAAIARMHEERVQAILIEVSAQALTRHRVDGINFDVVGFTNLSHDHFDDYASYDAYYDAKAQLFAPEFAQKSVVIVDDQWGQKLAREARIPVTTLSSNSATEATWHLDVTAETPTFTEFRLSGPENRVIETRIPLVGRFMASNAALAIVMLIEAGYDSERISHTLDRDGGVNAYIPGRAEIVSGDAGPVFYVDYGHTPDAFAEILDAVRAVTSGHVIMVFGADGDRDRSKRVEMGAIAANGADVVIVTDFHPRSEDPAEIRKALLAGARSISGGAEVHEIPDPSTAVRTAISLADTGDAIIYAGPGHEDYREVQGVKIAYNARQDVRRALGEAGFPPRASHEEGAP